MADHDGSSGKAKSRDKLEEVKDGAKRAARETAEGAISQTGTTSQTEDLSETLQRSAGRLSDQMRTATQSLLNEQKDRVAQGAHSLAEALHHAARALERDDNRTGARYADQFADQVEQLAGRMRNRQWSDILADAEALARREPQLFVMGAVAAGFFLGRLIGGSSGSGRQEFPRAYASSGAGSYHHGSAGSDEPVAGGYGMGSDI